MLEARAIFWFVLYRMLGAYVGPKSSLPSQYLTVGPIRFRRDINFPQFYGQIAISRRFYGMLGYAASNHFLF